MPEPYENWAKFVVMAGMILFWQFSGKSEKESARLNRPRIIGSVVLALTLLANVSVGFFSRTLHTVFGRHIELGVAALSVALLPAVWLGVQFLKRPYRTRWFCLHRPAKIYGPLLVVSAGSVVVAAMVACLRDMNFGSGGPEVIPLLLIEFVLILFPWRLILLANELDQLREKLRQAAKPEGPKG